MWGVGTRVAETKDEETRVLPGGSHRVSDSTAYPTWECMLQDTHGSGLQGASRQFQAVGHGPSPTLLI